MARRKAATWDEAMTAIAAGRFQVRRDRWDDAHVYIHGPRGGSEQYVEEVGVLLVEMAERCALVAHVGQEPGR